VGRVVDKEVTPGQADLTLVTKRSPELLSRQPSTKVLSIVIMRQRTNRRVAELVNLSKAGSREVQSGGHGMDVQVSLPSHQIGLPCCKVQPVHVGPASAR
jgi:hypothetical protein